MPRKLPPWLIVRRALKSVVSGVIFCLRALMVATIWLGALPWATVYAWRMYFNLGDVTCVLVHLLNATTLTVLPKRALDR